MAPRVAPELQAPPGWISCHIADIPAPVALFDLDLRYVAATDRWLDVFALSGIGLVGKSHYEVDPRSGPVLAEWLRQALDGRPVEACLLGEPDPENRSRRFELSVKPWRTPDGELAGVIASVQESATAVGEAGGNDWSDRLTGLAGRHRFMSLVRAQLGGNSRRQTAMFLLDIDNFKGVNDLYGAGVGDGVLKIIANRLLAGTRSRPASSGKGARRNANRGTDLVARLGADEFGIILGSSTVSLADAEAFARRLLQLIANPVMIGDECIRLSASIGYILTSPTHRTEDDALRDLDVALQEAKARGPNNAKAWEPSLTSTVGRRLALLDQLRRALDEGEFVLHYQPILRLSDGKVVGAEALLRWNHPSDGIVPPAAFLPVLEESGLIVPVGCWVLREVVRQMQIWQMLYGRDILEWVSVNVSARQFNDPSLLLSTLNEINESGFQLNRLKIEITESAVMRNPEITREVLNQLQELGIRIAIDDFGTGYSALGVLRHYVVDTIKIDRGFTNRLDTRDGRELIFALLKIAKIYGAEVVAEGVETVAQADILREAGCGFVQGYLFAKPMEGSFFGAYALTHLVEDSAAD